ncbi:MAG: Na+/H+ antiporter subunit E [Phycisphaerales bacterium]
MINSFLLNCVLALVYVALAGEFNSFNIVAGFVIGFVVLWMYGLPRPEGPVYNRRLFAMFRFVVYFVRILIRANLEIAWEIITPGLSQTPRIIRYEVSDLNEVQTTTLANLITLTPGTLVVDISDDGDWLYVHCMYADDPKAAVASLDELASRMRTEVFGL